jgi:hypothetical protein
MQVICFTVLGLWCHVEWYRVASILEECTGSIIGTEVGSYKMLVPVYWTIQSYILEDQTCNQECMAVISLKFSSFGDKIQN